MGKLAHPMPPSLEAEIFRLINHLMTLLGINEYCKWLAACTPVSWLTDAPYAEIRDGLSEMETLKRSAQTCAEFHRSNGERQI